MSQLKEQWGNLMKMRAGGSHSPSKSAVVSAVKTVLQQHLPGLAQFQESPRVTIKPEFEAFRAKVQSRISALQDIGTGLRKEPASTTVKQFIFGRNVQRAQGSRTPEPRSKLEAQLSAHEAKTIDQISKQQESCRFPKSETDLDSPFESVSIAHKSALGTYIENPTQDITISADIGPLARTMASHQEEEISGQFQTVEIDPGQISEDRIEFGDVVNFCMGRIGDKKLLARFRVSVLQEKPNKGLSITIDTPQSYASPQNQLVQEEKSADSSSADTRGKSKSLVPQLFPLTPEPGVNKEQLEGEVEVRIAELMTSIREREGDGQTGDKVQKLMEQFNKELDTARTEHDRLKTRLLIQFLQEYQRVREARSQHAKKAHLKPAVPKVRRTPKSEPQAPPLDPSAYYYSPHDSVKAKAGTIDPSFQQMRRPVPTEMETSGGAGNSALVMRQGWSTSTRPAVLQAKYSPLKHESPTSGSAGGSQTPTPASTKRNYANATAASTSKATKRQEEASVPTMWIGGEKHKEDFDDLNWASPGEDSGKRKAQPRQMKDRTHPE